MLSELDKLKAGDWYCFSDKEVAARKAHAAKLCQEFNAISATDTQAQITKMQEILGSYGDRLSVQANFNCDYGKNIHVGHDFLSNYNLTILDMAPVTIGNNVMIGPNCGIYTVNHPMNAKGRRKYLAQAKPVTIGNDVWFGGSVTVLPGVTIGNNVVIAAGSVVTKGVPDDTLVPGVPAQPIRKLDEE